MYDELVKRLRDAATMSEALAVLLPNSEGNATAKLYNEAADAIEKPSMKLHGDEAAIAGMKREIERMVVAGKQKWIPVTEQMPDDGTYVLISFKRNMAVAYRWVGRWHVMCGGGWKTPILHGEQEPTHWMPLPSTEGLNET